MVGRRAQAALEFLTTYGWAFLVLTMMIGAMSYFGLLNPSNVLPERCTFASDFICEDFLLNGETQMVDLQLRHNFGETILVENVTCTFPDDSIDVYGFSGAEREWRVKQTKNVTCAAGLGNPLTSGVKDKVLFELVYKMSDTGYDHVAKGEVFANSK